MKGVKKMKLPSLLMLLLVLSCSSPVSTIQTEQELGEALFFDPVLSRDSSISCASCHRPKFGFADSLMLSPGVGGKKGKRNTPSVLNQAERNFYFWDGRAADLEEQALGPMENSVEMDFPVTLSIRRLLRSERYRKAFMHIYGQPPAKALLASAIAAYERTLESGKTDFDKYVSGEDTNAISVPAKRGLALFNGKARCFDCHFGVDFTGLDRFKNIGLYDGKDWNDEGRLSISGRESDRGAFKVPGLRNIAVTAPYMHNGMFKDLHAVIAHYNDPDRLVPGAINRDSVMKKPLGLTKDEQNDLVAFLNTLTEEKYQNKLTVKTQK
jgi:cytochrome c peroxidase